MSICSWKYLTSQIADYAYYQFTMEGDYSGREKEKPLQKAETNPNPNLTLTLNAYKKVLAERVTHFFQFWLFIFLGKTESDWRTNMHMN